MLRKLIRCACLLIVALGCAAAQEPVNSDPAPDLNTIISRMLAAQQRNKAHVRPFSVKRDYQLLDKEQVQKAQVIAHITYVPPDQKKYQIESSHGGLGERILKDVLEKDLQPPKDPDRHELSQKNYDFQFLGTEAVDGHGCYVLGLNPKRNDKELIEGKLWVDQQTYNIRRLEGKPSKSPSWWVHDVHLLMSYADVDGMWLRTFTYAVANVRFRGKYEMVSRDIEYHVASKQVAGRTVRRTRPSIVTGAVIEP